MNPPTTIEEPAAVDHGPVWHLVAEVLADSQVRTVCGRQVSRGEAGPSTVGRVCRDCEGSGT